MPLWNYTQGFVEITRSVHTHSSTSDVRLLLANNVERYEDIDTRG